jgi:hypothetical protein
VCEIRVKKSHRINNIVTFELYEGGMAHLGVEAWGQPIPSPPPASWNLYSYLIDIRIMFVDVIVELIQV